MAVLSVVGCTESEVQEVTGTVTLDGAPLTSGQIQFIPDGDTGGPTAGATIENGAYTIPAVKAGLKTHGTYAVKITAMKGNGVMVPDPNEPSGKREMQANYLPSRYNETTELKVTISAKSSENEKDFALTSGKS